MGANENVTNESVAIVVADEDEDEVKGKVGLIEYILHEHSVLSICFAADGWTPNVPCCFCCTTCCCLVIDNAKFTVPMRIYLFIFVFLGTIWIMRSVTVGGHWSIWRAYASTLLLMPVTCWLKRSMPSMRVNLIKKFGKWAADIFFISVLILILLYMTYHVLTDHKKNEWRTLKLASIALGMQMLAEFPVIIWKFFCCTICCKCCVPDKADMMHSHYARIE